MSDVAFIYRFYNNGGCDHTSSANDTFPANGASPLSAGSGQCLSPPTSSIANWTTVEFNVNASASASTSELVVFCGADCSGTGNDQPLGDACVGAPSGCNVGSFFVISPDSGTAGGATATLTMPNPVTVIATTTLKAATSTSTSSQVSSAPRKGAGNTWEIVAGVLLAVTALSCLVLMAHCWRRRRGARRRTGALFPGGVRGHAFEDGADFASRGNN